MSCTQDTTSIALSVAGGALSAALKISADAGNIATVHADGLWIPTYVDIGDLIWSGRTTKGANFLLANGAAVSRSTYALLFAQYGTTFGAGDGSTTFNLPDLQGRMPVGLGLQADVLALGANEGMVAANRRPKHRTSITDPGHSHTFTFYQPGGFTNGANAIDLDAVVSGTKSGLINSATTGITVGTGAGTDSVDTSPYLVLNPFVRAL